MIESAAAKRSDSTMAHDIRLIMTAGPVIPVLVISREADAVPLARALVNGGVRALEVTLRSDAALAAIKAIAREVPEAIVGAGTVLDPEQLRHSADAGAQFIVSPGLTENVARAAHDARIAFLPGVATASDIMRALDLGLAHLKFFPAETSGGAPAVNAFAGPFPDLRFCPTGGITPALAPNYLALSNVLCVGGSWLAPKEAVAAGDWGKIERLAKEAAARDNPPLEGP